MKQFFAKTTPEFLKPMARKIYYFPLEIIDKLQGRNEMLPPRSLISYIGGGDFEKNGQQFQKYFVELGGLQPHHRVLDVGCGIGRLAIPLTNYLSPKGEYWGIDIVYKGIDWCQKNISPKFNNFHFLHSDIHNTNYNPKGKLSAAQYTFPFENQFFDFIFLTSVFTHMVTPSLENYVAEISRTLKKGGKCFMTFFILNEESEKLMNSGQSSFNFKYSLEGCFTTNLKDPEYATAYKEEFLKELFEKHNLKIEKPIRYGSWCNRDTVLSYQDIIIVTKI